MLKNALKREEDAPLSRLQSRQGRKSKQVSSASMRIIRKLPPAPAPTRAKKVTLPEEKRGRSLAIESIGDAVRRKEAFMRSSVAKARAVAEGNAERRHDMIARLAREGLSDAEISAQTGYKPSSVHRLISKMRKEGINIPERKRGVKCKR
jgi:biotin operon repressor